MNSQSNESIPSYKYNNNNDFIILSMLLYLFFHFFLNVKVVQVKYYEEIIIMIYIFLEYILSIIWLNIFTLFENKIEIFYPTRVFKRKKVINYSEITKIIYKNTWNYPTIAFYKSNKQSIFLPSNSFTCGIRKKRVAILKFLHSRGLQIEIKSDSDKDKTMLD